MIKVYAAVVILIILEPRYWKMYQALPIEHSLKKHKADGLN